MDQRLVRDFSLDLRVVELNSLRMKNFQTLLYLKEF